MILNEIDHCHHKMCVDAYDFNFPRGTQDDLISLRKEEMTKKKQILGLGPDDFFPLMPIKETEEKESK